MLHARMTSVTPATHSSAESHFYADRGRHASPTACAGNRMVRLDELPPRRPFFRHALERVDGDVERAAVLADAAEQGLARKIHTRSESRARNLLKLLV